MSEQDLSTEDSFYHLKRMVAAGDLPAFRQIFDLLFSNLSQFAYSLVKSKDAANEIAAELFVRLWNNRAQIEAIDNLKVYLYKAAKNSSLNYLSRKAHLRMHEPFDDINIVLKEDSSPEQLLITKEILNRIKQAIDELPPRCKMIFKLIREDGLKYKEVAAVLNLSVKTVDAQMAIAVSRIREKLEGHLYMPVKKNPQKK